MKKILFFLVCLLTIRNTQAQTPVFDWARSSGGNGNEYPAGLVADAAGNTYVTGNFDSRTDFDPGPGVLLLEPQGSSDIYLLKLNNSGNLVWARQIGGSGEKYASGINTDAMGNLFIAGSFTDTCDFDPGPGEFKLVSASKSTDIFLLKLDAAGGLVWAQSMGGKGNDVAYVISPDHAGNILVSGTFTDTADLDPGPGNTDLVSAGGKDIFVCKLNGSGNLIWARNMGGSNEERCQTLTTDATGQIYIGGTFEGIADFDPGPGSYTLSTGSQRAFLCKLGASGSFLWAESMATASAATAIKAGNDGYLYLCGTFTGITDFDPGPGKAEFRTKGSSDMYILKLDTSGKYIWAKTIGGPGDDYISSLVLDEKNNIYTTGSFVDTADFDPGPGTERLACNDDFFVLKLDSAGDFIWAKNATGLSTGTDIAVNKDLDVFVCGWFSEKTDFDPGSSGFELSPAGDGSTVDLFVYKMKQPATHIAALAGARQLQTYPNPGAGIFTIVNPVPGTELELEIADPAGRIVRRQKSTESHIRLDLQAQPQGLYLLRAKTEESLIYRQLILKQ